MKAKELAEKLLENPEFEVKALHLYPSVGWGCPCINIVLMVLPT